MNKTIKLLAASALILASSIGTSFGDNSNIRVGFTPKFLKDDFQTLMTSLSKKAFAEKGFTLVGAPDPNGDISAQVNALQIF